jgi:RHS repeat-associated protein
MGSGREQNEQTGADAGVTVEYTTSAATRSLAVRPIPRHPRRGDSPKTLTPVSRMKKLGLRYYSANLSRWLSRDPDEEDAGMNIYCFVLNEPIGILDAIGLHANVEKSFADEVIKTGDQQFLLQMGWSLSEPSWVKESWLGGVDGAVESKPAIVVMERTYKCPKKTEKCCHLKLTRVELTLRVWVQSQGLWFVHSHPSAGHELQHVKDYKAKQFLKTYEYAKGREGCYKGVDECSCWQGVAEKEAPLYFYYLALKETLERDKNQKTYEQKKRETETKFVEAEKAWKDAEKKCKDKSGK